MLIISQCSWCSRTGAPVLAATACWVSSLEINYLGRARFVVSELQRFLAYCNIIHCGLSGKKPSNVSATQYLLDLAKRIPYMCIDKLFGLNGAHSNVNLGATALMVPLMDDCPQRDFFMDERGGVFQTLPLNKDKIWRAIYELLKRAPVVAGDHGIIETLFGPEQKWVPGPGW